MGKDKVMRRVGNGNPLFPLQMLEDEVGFISIESERSELNEWSFINEMSFSLLGRFMRNASKSDKVKYRKIIKKYLDIDLK